MTLSCQIYIQVQTAIIKLLIRCMMFCCEAKQKLKTFMYGYNKITQNSFYVSAGKHKQPKLGVHLF